MVTIVSNNNWLNFATDKNVFYEQEQLYSKVFRPKTGITLETCLLRRRTFTLHTYCTLLFNFVNSLSLFAFVSNIMFTRACDIPIYVFDVNNNCFDDIPGGDLVADWEGPRFTYRDHRQNFHMISKRIVLFPI